jgi:hypothetical protein
MTGTAFCVNCDKWVPMDPPALRAQCPHCGFLLWFAPQERGLLCIKIADLEFRTGEQVRIHDGTFQGYTAKFLGMSAASGKAKVSINIFGRDVQTELPVSLLCRTESPCPGPSSP